MDISDLLPRVKALETKVERHERDIVRHEEWTCSAGCGFTLRNVPEVAIPTRECASCGSRVTSFQGFLEE